MPDFFKFQPSRIFAFLLLAVYSTAITCIGFLPFTALLKLLFVLILMCSFVYYFLRYARLSLPISYAGLRFEEGSVILILQNGDRLQGRISHTTLVTPLMTVLNVVAQENKRLNAVVIFPDSMHPERFRELRIMLKWGCDELV